ncbi:MAG: hypothetical protein GF311_07630 [Candidatus Lokiarchaeota archaeon]|nr:hypothetical protein [Candidatus Lokiarchaeota archaeon]
MKYYIDNNGYKRYSDSNKLVHRQVAEMMLGRKLRSSEVVHHKNRNKLDNRRSNLWVFKSQQKHYRIHKLDEKRNGQW